MRKGLVIGVVSALIIAVVATLAIKSSVAAAPHDDSKQNGQNSGHVFIIAMENHLTDQIIGNTDAPYINQLATDYAVDQNYYGVTHPSLPNYLTLVSGDYQGIWDDCKAGAAITCAPQEFVPSASDATNQSLLTAAQVTASSAVPHLFNGKNLIDQLESKHLTWKAYMENLPTAGSTVEYAPVINGTTVKLYAQKHNPFMYFSDITTNASRLAKIVPFDQSSFAHDLNSNSVPNFVWISPNQCNDMHGISPSGAALVNLPDCGYPAAGLDHKIIARGDAFVKQTVQAIMSSKAWNNNSSIVLWWDENDYSGSQGCCNSPTGQNGVVLGGGHAPLIVITPRHGGDDDNHAMHTYYLNANHYNLLATIERHWGLGCLANSCKVDDDQLLNSLFGWDD